LENAEFDSGWKPQREHMQQPNNEELRPTRSLSFAHPSVKLNLGAGPTVIGGFIGVDRKSGGEVYPLRIPASDAKSIAGIEADGLVTPADGSIDEIRASHVLEHFGYQDAMLAIREWVQKLKPGGVLRIAVPDFDGIVAAIGKGNPNNWPIQRYIYGGQTDEDDFHKCAFNEEYLRHLMAEAGLVDISRWTSEIVDCAALPISLNLMGRKSAWKEPPPKLPKITAVMSMPRLAFSDNMFSMIQVATRRQFEFVKVTGAFWSQCLTRGIEPLLNDGTEWVLAVDYDSIVSVKEFDAIARLMIEHPEADAIAPMQVKRDDDNMLMGVCDASGKALPPGTPITLRHFEPPLVRTAWAHFGFTFLRVSAIKRMRKPWFFETPDPSGSWGDGRVDSDIQFWRNWQDAGNTLYLASHVAIGHAQMMCTYPKQDLSPMHVYMGDANKPDVLASVRH
jgi:hypothetical protein